MEPKTPAQFEARAEQLRQSWTRADKTVQRRTFEANRHAETLAAKKLAGGATRRVASALERARSKQTDAEAKRDQIEVQLGKLERAFEATNDAGHVPGQPDRLLAGFGDLHSASAAQLWPRSSRSRGQAEVPVMTRASRTRLRGHRRAVVGARRHTSGHDDHQHPDMSVR